jgi:uncharacterized damage-inducible protein DinB
MAFQSEDIRALFEYDAWATRQVLVQLDDLDEAPWGATGVVGERGLGSILVHMLGAHQRWRLGIAAYGAGEQPEPELEPLPDVAALVARWEAELAATEPFLDFLTDGYLAHVEDGISIGQMLIHLVNHGTQHRSEAALLLTQAGRSPGELDLIVYLEEVVPTLGRPAIEPAGEGE